MVIKKALYGLKTSGATFRALLAERLREIGFSPSKADPDVWMRPGVKPNGFEYWEYILCCVDDVLCVSHKSKETLQALKMFCKLKDYKVEDLQMYLGAEVSKIQSGGTEFWTMNGKKVCKICFSKCTRCFNIQGAQTPQ